MKFKKITAIILTFILTFCMFTYAFATTDECTPIYTAEDSDFVDTPTPDPEPENNVESAEIVSIPLKNKIVFSYGSPASPDGIVLKLKFKDGTESTETIRETEYGMLAGRQLIFGGVHLDVVDFGKHTETLYINDESVSVEYDYYVIPPLRSIFYRIFDILFGYLLPPVEIY